MSERDEILARCAPSVGVMLDRRVEATPDSEAFRYRDASESWQSLSWTEARQEAHVVAAGLLALGLGFEERVAIASGTRIEWVLMDLGINCAAGATTTIYPNTTGEEFEHIVRHSDAKYFVAENAEQLAKLEAVDDLRAQLRTVILLEGASDAEGVITWQQFLDRGRAHLTEQPDAVRAAIDSTGPDTLATLIYTSGTTGLPKGAELTHQCWAYEGAAVNALDIIDHTKSQYLWLPLSHVFGKCLIACQLAIGFSSIVDGRLDKIVSGLGDSQPTFMCGAPRIYEKVRNAVLTASGSSGLKAGIARWAFAVGRNSRPFRLSGHALPWRLGVQYKLAERLVFGKLHKLMGGRIEFFISGSAKLSAQVQEWFYSAGITIVEGYGLTETSAVTFLNEPAKARFGTVGPAVPGTEVRIAEDGEVWVRGPGVMRGYHKDPERTAEVLVDGWLATGDIGELDADGYLTITDRKKDLLKTSGGKCVAPQKVENAIAANIPYVSQAVAVGDGRKYISALVTMDGPMLEKWAKRHKIEGLSYAELTQLPEIRKSIDRFMTRVNGRLEKWETVKRYAILDHEFSVDDGSVTPNMKVRRAAIAERYADVVDSLYDAE